MKDNQLNIFQDNHVDFFEYISSSEKAMDTYVKSFDGNIEDLWLLIEDYHASKGTSKDIISFKDLYKLDSEWYDYFKENTDKEGNCVRNEKRKGVNREHVNDIMMIKKKIKMIDLETAISLHAFFQTYGR